MSKEETSNQKPIDYYKRDNEHYTKSNEKPLVEQFPAPVGNPVKKPLVEQFPAPVGNPVEKPLVVKNVRKFKTSIEKNFIKIGCAGLLLASLSMGALALFNIPYNVSDAEIAEITHSPLTKFEASKVIDGKYLEMPYGDPKYASAINSSVEKYHLFSLFGLTDEEKIKNTKLFVSTISQETNEDGYFYQAEGLNISLENWLDILNNEDSFLVTKDGRVIVLKLPGYEYLAEIVSDEEPRIYWDRMDRKRTERTIVRISPFVGLIIGASSIGISAYGMKERQKIK